MNDALIQVAEELLTKLDSSPISSLQDMFRSVVYDHTPSGEEVIRVITYGGDMYVRVKRQGGVVFESNSNFPLIHSKEERDKVIRDMAKERLKQEDIAAILGISQGTVSNVLRKKNKKD